MWDPVIHKFEKKLSSWKRQYLSLGERITLIKACLSNIPVYYMSLFKMPKVVVERLDLICRNFLWEGKSNKKKLHLMKWSEVIKPKSCGGLGLGDLKYKNAALLAKWQWRFGDEREARWRKVTADKYGVEKSRWWPNPGRKSHRSSLWGAIASVGDSPSVSREVLSKGVGFVVGDGRVLRFWLDDWVGVGPLYELFPRVFRLVSNKEFHVTNCCGVRDGCTLWGVTFRRGLRCRRRSNMGSC